MIRGIPLEDLYFEWLYGLFASVKNKNPKRSYWKMARRLHGTEFVYFVPNDENRALDGKDLRGEFLFLNPDVRRDQEWLDQECSMLELLLGLSVRAEFLADRDSIDGGVGGWFWLLARNVGLYKFTDDYFIDRSLEEIDRVIYKINHRTYDRDGSGGLFPVVGIRKDMRRIELWHQLNAYLLKYGYINTNPDE